PARKMSTNVHCGNHTVCVLSNCVQQKEPMDIAPLALFCLWSPVCRSSRYTLPIRRQSLNLGHFCANGAIPEGFPIATDDKYSVTIARQARAEVATQTMTAPRRRVCQRPIFAPVWGGNRCISRPITQKIRG